MKTIWNKKNLFISIPGLIILLEGCVYFFLLQKENLSLTALSVSIATVAVLSVYIPLILKPGEAACLAGVLGVLLAAIMIQPPGNLFSGFRIDSTEMSFHLSLFSWRMINVVLLMPIAYILAGSVSFPIRFESSKKYFLLAVTTILLGILLIIPWGGVRVIIRYLVFAWMSFLFFGSIVLLALSARKKGEILEETATRSRVLLFFVGLSQLPVIIRLIGLLLSEEWIPFEVIQVAQLLLPAGMAYTILKHDLFDIDRLARRTFSYGAATAILLGCYAGVVFIFGSFIQIPQRFAFPLIGGAIVLSAAIFIPLQKRILEKLENWLFPERLVFKKALKRIEDSLGIAKDREEIFTLVVEEFPKIAGAAWAALSFMKVPEPPPDKELTGSWGVSLFAAGECRGGFWLGERVSRLPYNENEILLLNSFSKELSLALAYVDVITDLRILNAELEARVEEKSRQVIDKEKELAVAEERYRVARDLHDSISQRLFSLSLSARAVRKMTSRNPQDAAAELEFLEQSARMAQQEMRDLLDKLRKPLPTEKNEKPADVSKLINETLLEYQQSWIIPIAANIQPGLYLNGKFINEIAHILKEAMHNIEKHSAAGQVQCNLFKKENQIRLEIKDDGKGFTPGQFDNSSGKYGLLGMSERATQAGMHLEINSSLEKGTSIFLDIPLEEEE